MALKHVCATALILLSLPSACAREKPQAAKDDEPEALSVTRWTDKTELFAEYPPLVAGNTSRFAIHLTRLDSFKAVADGSVDVQLRGDNGAPETFRADAPSRPGIFGVDVKPAQPGTRQLVIVLRAAGLQDEHRLDVLVHATADAARAAAQQGDAGGGISFLKEQQWSLDFGTAVVREQSVRESVRVPAQLVPRPAGAADVVAPIDGRLTRVLDVPVGANVSRGQELARLLPRAATPGDLPQLERDRDEARTALSLAVRDRERAERLTSAGAAPQKRLEEARTAEQLAKSRVTAADASLAQYNAARNGAAAGTAGLFIVRAPVGGIIASRDGTAGTNITAGTVLFTVMDTSQIHVVGKVPEAQVSKIRMITGAEIEIPGRPDRVPLGRLAGAGKVLDPEARTLPVTFAFDNRGLALPIGQTVSLYLLMATGPQRPVVPSAAIVDDAGRPIVFVQREGETFERRPVTLGARSGDVVQILDGVKTGERVVTKGAYLVRLASLSTSVPAHGHVH